jgi:hypothetical protein
MKNLVYSSFAAIIIFVSILGCSTQRIEQGGGLYADDLTFENKYYINNWEFTITDPSNIKKIGTVQKSRRLDKGNDVFEMEGYPNRNFIAVKDKESFTGYSIYSEYKGDGMPISLPQDISYSRVNQIKIYKEIQLIHNIQGEAVQTFISLFKQKSLPNEFIVEHPPQYHVIFLTDTSLGYKYPISEKDGQFGMPMWESKLPEEIAEYFKPKQ